MDPCLEDFRSALTGLRHYVDGFEYIGKVVAASETDKEESEETPVVEMRRHFRTHVTRRRQFEYNSAIVSMYGLLERFLETLITHYLSRMAAFVPTYAEMPKSVRAHHLELTLDVLQKRERQEYCRLSVPKMLADLSSCLNTGEGYRFDPLPFTHHASNFRVSSINEFFRKVGLGGIATAIARDATMQEFLGTYDAALVEPTVPPAIALGILDDLADRRNEVSHGMPGQLLSTEILKSYIAFLDVFGTAATAFVKRALIPYAKQYRGIRLGCPIAVFNHVIACFDSGVEIATGDILIAGPPDESERSWGEILELQQDDKTVDQFVPHTSHHNKVACRVSFRIKETHEVFLVRASETVL
jgi:hypothetical protein